MEGKNRMTFALIAGVIILTVSLAVAYVSFNILESSAEANLQNWKLGGGIAGFAFTASLLTSIVFQVYKQLTSDSIRNYQREIEELRTKIIKGAPCPRGYTVDIDERRKLVFARPEEWVPRGGLIYQYVCPDDPDNEFLEHFTVFYHRAPDPAPNNVEEMYKVRVAKTAAYLKRRFKSGKITTTHEYVSVDNVKSLKATFTHTPDPATLDRKDKTALRQTVVFTYVPRLKNVYEFTFAEDEEHYLESSEVFNNIISSIRFL